ncbi:unnamed protein product [Prunus armeniaca]
MHIRILNTRALVTSPTLADYPAIHFHVSKYPCPLFPSISIQGEVHMIEHIMYRGKQSNVGIVWLNHTNESSTTMWLGTSHPTRGTGLTGMHNRILNTRVPVTSPTHADYLAKCLW